MKETTLNISNLNTHYYHTAKFKMYPSALHIFITGFSSIFN